MQHRIHICSQKEGVSWQARQHGAGSGKPVSALGSKLKKLYGLAILRPSEEKDEARQNEARNAAYLLLKLARDNNVQIKFVVRDDSVQGPSQGYARYQPPQPNASANARRTTAARPSPQRQSRACDGLAMCPCGKSVESRTWYDVGVGCTHVTTQ